MNGGVLSGCHLFCWILAYRSRSHGSREDMTCVEIGLLGGRLVEADLADVSDGGFAHCFGWGGGDGDVRWQ